MLESSCFWGFLCEYFKVGIYILLKMGFLRQCFKSLVSNSFYLMNTFIVLTMCQDLYYMLFINISYFNPHINSMNKYYVSTS